MSAYATSPQFKDNAHRALGDSQLQKALGNVRQNFIARRAIAAGNRPSSKRCAIRRATCATTCSRISTFIWRPMKQR